MKKLTFNFLPALLMAGLVNIYSLAAAPLSFTNDGKDKITTPQDTVTTNKARAKRGVKEVGKGTKDLAVSGAKATGKGAKKAGKAVKRTTKKGVEKAGEVID